MLALPSITNSSPLGLRGLTEKEQEVTARGLRRLIRSSFSRNPDDKKENADDTLLQIKMRILQKNPYIYKLFRATLVDSEFYTHWAVSYAYHHFLDTYIKIPDLKEEIRNHDLNRTRASGIFAYLKGDHSPSSQKKRMSCTHSPTSVKTHDMCDELSLQSLSLPCLDNDCGELSDDNSVGCGGGSCRSFCSVNA